MSLYNLWVAFSTPGSCFLESHQLTIQFLFAIWHTLFDLIVSEQWKISLYNLICELHSTHLAHVLWITSTNLFYCLHFDTHLERWTMRLYSLWVAFNTFGSPFFGMTSTETAFSLQFDTLLETTYGNIFAFFGMTSTDTVFSLQFDTLEKNWNIFVFAFCLFWHEFRVVL